MSEKHIVVLISGSGSNLQAFIDAANENRLGGKIVAVLSNKANAYGLLRAAQAGIDPIVVEHSDFESREAFDRVLMSRISQYQPDLIILAGFMRILTPEFVKAYNGKLLNIHPSLLPKYPGLHTHRRALQNEDQYHGTSVHYVTDELDGGPIIAQARMTLDHRASEELVMQQIQELEHQLYPQVAAWFLSDRLVMRKDGIYFDNKKLHQPILVEQELQE